MSDDATKPPEQLPAVLTATEKGRLLADRVRSGSSVRGQRFDGALLAGAALEGADLRGVSLRGADMRGCRLAGAHLDDADLCEADLRGADLRGASLINTVFRDADLAGADLTAVELRETDFRGANLAAARGDLSSTRPYLIDGRSFERSRWPRERLLLQVSSLVCARGAFFPAPLAMESRPALREALLGRADTFPDETRGWMVEDRHGLMLTFDTRLHRFDGTAFDALVARVLGPDTDVTIEERSNIGADGPAFIRLNGSSPEDLAAVAEAFYERAWSSAEVVTEERALRRAGAADLAALLLRRLDVLQAAVTGATINHPAVQAMLTDQADAHALSKVEATRRIEELNTRVGQEREARRALEALFGFLFAPGSLHAWVGAHLGAALANALPTPPATHEEIVAGLVLALERRGRVDLALFEALEERAPDEAEVVWGVAAKWGERRE